MEMMILSILSPILMCEWHLKSFQEALITTVCAANAIHLVKFENLYLSLLLRIIFGFSNTWSPKDTYSYVVFIFSYNPLTAARVLKAWIFFTETFFKKRHLFAKEEYTIWCLKGTILLLFMIYGVIENNF